MAAILIAVTAAGTVNVCLCPHIYSVDDSKRRDRRRLTAVAHDNVALEPEIFIIHPHPGASTFPGRVRAGRIKNHKSILGVGFDTCQHNAAQVFAATFAASVHGELPIWLQQYDSLLQSLEYYDIYVYLRTEERRRTG